MPKVGGIYKWDPTNFDKVYLGSRAPKKGEFVKCVKPAGNIGTVPSKFKFITSMSGKFYGMVMSNSLEPLTAADRKLLKGKRR
jgi:hypothetical protein